MRGMNTYWRKEKREMKQRTAKEKESRRQKNIKEEKIP